MKKLSVLVTGSRTYEDHEKVKTVLSRFARSRYPLEVLVGDCPTGADAFARDWCSETGTPCRVFAADWNTHGKAAGPIRNRQMVAEKPSLVLAFFNGESRGTKNCVEEASKRGINVIEFGRSRDS